MKALPFALAVFGMFLVWILKGWVLASLGILVTVRAGWQLAKGYGQPFFWAGLRRMVCDLLFANAVAAPLSIPIVVAGKEQASFDRAFMAHVYAIAIVAWPVAFLAGLIWLSDWAMRRQEQS